uniref:Apple domain-containing protein n=1 Tax=Panagrolaimus sp. ES5 TaxID=591445 RepID=A0AC34FDG3_9BILA
MKVIFVFLLFFILIDSISNCGFWLDKNVDGSDIGTKNGGLDECCGFCKAQKGCIAFSWKDVDGGTCFLKSAAGPFVKELETTFGIVQG